MRIKQDHRKADQSEGAGAGSKGSSYFTTVPRIIPMNAEYVSSDAGTGDSTATVSPAVRDRHRLSVAIHLLDYAQTPRLELCCRDLFCRHFFLPVEVAGCE